MTRGEVVTVVLPGDYGKPRPGVIVQTDLINATHPSVLVFPCTTELTSDQNIRLLVEPTSANGLRARSKIMVDKLTAVPRTRIRSTIGRLEAHHVAELSRLLMLILDLP